MINSCLLTAALSELKGLKWIAMIEKFMININTPAKDLKKMI